MQADRSREGDDRCRRCGRPPSIDGAVAPANRAKDALGGVDDAAGKAGAAIDAAVAPAKRVTDALDGIDGAAGKASKALDEAAEPANRAGNAMGDMRQ